MNGKNAIDCSSGFSLIESLAATAILGVSILFLMQLMSAGMQLNYVSADEMNLNVLAIDRLEQIRNLSYVDIGKGCIESNNTCGSLTSNITDTSVTPNVKYFDDTNSNYVIRWVITKVDESGNPLEENWKRIIVEAISQKQEFVGKQRTFRVYYDKYKF